MSGNPTLQIWINGQLVPEGEARVSVFDSGFGPPPADPPELEGRARTVAESCQPLYRQLYSRRLKSL